MSEVPSVPCPLVKRFNRDYRYALYQFTLPSVPANGMGEVFRLQGTPTAGVVVKLRTISYSDHIILKLSSSPNMDDVYRWIMEMEADKQDYSYDYHNGDFMQYFFLDEASPFMYARVENLGSVDTQSIIIGMILGD